MKTAFLLCAALLPLAATAQKLVATAPPITYRVSAKKAFLYRTPTDTVDKKSSYFLYSGAEAIVVGVFSPHWVIIKREGYLYLLRSKELVNYEPDVVVPPGILSSMPIDPETKLITYQGVVEVPGISKADLFLRAHAWVAKTYQSANNVIQMQDKDAGQLIIKGVIKIGSGITYDGVVRHTLTIYVKDGRYKYILTDLNHDAAGAQDLVSGGHLEQPMASVAQIGSRISSKVSWPYIQVIADTNARSLVNGLQAAMTLKGAKDPSDF